MNFLERAIKRGIDRAVGNAVEQGVKNAVQPAVNKAAANVANAAAANLSDAAKSMNEANAELEKIDSQQLSAAVSALESIAVNMAKDKKICEKCGAMAKAEEKFCQTCGAKLPELTLAEAAVCTQCGRQNDLGKNFCAGCGAKLPAKIAAEKAAAAANAEVLERFDKELPQFPKWACGGTDLSLEAEDMGDGMTVYRFSVKKATEANLNQYLALLKANSFRQKYKDSDQIYINSQGGTDYLIDFTDAICDDGLYFSFCIEPHA